MVIRSTCPRSGIILAAALMGSAVCAEAQSRPIVPDGLTAALSERASQVREPRLAASSSATRQTPAPARQRDSVLNGVLIGAAVGALAGLIPDYYDDCEECHDALYGSIAVGAGIGLVVDLLRKPRATPSRSIDQRVRLNVSVRRSHIGLGARLTWR